jgi:hypothetical protein
MSATAERPILTPEFGEADPKAGGSAVKLINAILPRFVFSPFLTLPLDNERLMPRLIKPARITTIREFVRHDRNFEFLKESEAISQSESMNNAEFVHTLVRPGDIEMTLRNVFGYSGSVATGFIIIDELTGQEPDKREEDKQLIVDLQAGLLPFEPADSIEQIEMLEEALASKMKDLDGIYGKVGQRLLDSTLTARAFCEQHIANTEAEMEMRASAGGSDQARGKMMLSAFDRMVCDWLRRPYPRISSKLTYEAETRGRGDTATRGQGDSAASGNDRATIDPNVLGHAIAASMPGIIEGLKEAGVIETGTGPNKPTKNRKNAKLDEKPEAPTETAAQMEPAPQTEAAADNGPLTTDH